MDSEESESPAASSSVQKRVYSSTREIETALSIGTVVCQPFPESSKSSILADYSNVVDKQNGNRTGFARCNSCGNSGIYKYDGKTGTTNLRKHFSEGRCKKKTAAASQSEDSRQTDITSFTTRLNRGTAVTLTAVQKKNLESSLLKFVCLDMRPMYSVEGAGMESLVNELLKLGSELGRNVTAADILPSHQTVARSLHRTAAKQRERLSPSLQAAASDCGIGYTTDHWTDDHRQESYSSLSATFVSNDFKLTEINLKTGKFGYQKKTAENIWLDIAETLHSYSIPLDSLGAFTTDQGSNQIKAFENSTFPRINCAAHVISTILKNTFALKLSGDDDDSAEGNDEDVEEDDMSEEENLITVRRTVSKCKKLVRYLKKSGLSRQLDKQLTQEVETRWYSLYDMLLSVDENWENVLRVLVDADGDETKLTTIKRSALKEIVVFLDRFIAAVKGVNGSDYPTLHLVWPLFVDLQNFTARNSQDSEYCKALKSKCREPFYRKWTELITDCHIAATILSPKFKDLALRNKMSTEDEVRKGKQKLTELVLRLGEQKQPSADDPSAKRTRMENTMVLTLAERLGQDDSEDEDDTPIAELQRYFDYRIPKERQNDEILSFWRDQQTSFPTVAKVARFLLAIPASSAASERFFSAAGNLIRVKRNRLMPDTVNDMLFMRSYLKTGLNL